MITTATAAERVARVLRGEMEGLAFAEIASGDGALDLTQEGAAFGIVSDLYRDGHEPGEPVPIWPGSARDAWQAAECLGDAVLIVAGPGPDDLPTWAAYEIVQAPAE